MNDRAAGRQIVPHDIEQLERVTFGVAPFERELRAGDIRYVEDAAGPNPFKVYDRAASRCPRCRKGTIVRLVQAGRATFYCDNHQK